MDWWNDLTDWTASDTGWRVLSGAIIPFIAIVVAGVIAALIGRAAAKRVVALHDRESRNAAVAGIVSVSRKASRWGSLGHEERAYTDHLAEDADIRLRMLPVSGAALAADWAQHEIADIKRNSSTFTSTDQSLGELRDRLLEWNARPNRARKLFKSDLERWKFDSPDPDAELIGRQQDWNADQQQKRGAADADAPSQPATPTTTALRPTLQQQPVVAPSAPAPGSVDRDQDATTPINDLRPAPDNRTRPYGQGETVPLDGAPVRPPLGSPIAPGRPSTPAPAARNDVGGHDVGGHDVGGHDADARDVDATDQDRTPSSPRIASPTAADAHVNRASGSATGLDRTADQDTRPGDADDPAAERDDEPSPYTQPISASELRRRAGDDD